MQSTITGRAYVLGDNVDTDQIIPAQYLTLNPAIPDEYRQFGKYALSSVPPAQAGLPKGHVPFHTDDPVVSPYKIIVGGKNFGCGSSREHAPIALDAAGIEAVVAEFYDPFLRPQSIARYLEALLDDTPLRQWQRAGFAEVAHRLATDRPPGEIGAGVVMNAIAGRARGTPLHSKAERS